MWWGQRRRKVEILGLVWVLGSLGLACGHTKDRGQAALEATYPLWVRQGSGLVIEDNHRALVAVGHVSGIRNVALARSTADNRARAELVGVLEQLCTALMRDFQASQATTPTHHADEEISVEQAIKVLTAASLGGVNIVQHGFFGGDNSVFAAARLDFDPILDGAVRIRELSAPLRDWLMHHAQETFDEMYKTQQITTSMRQAD